MSKFLAYRTSTHNWLRKSSHHGAREIKQKVFGHHRQRALLSTTVKKPTRRIRLHGKSNVLRDPQNFACLGTVVSRAKRSRRHARRRLRDATLYSPRDTPTRPLDRSTLSVRVETTRRVLRSRSETFYYETIYIFSSIFSFRTKEPFISSSSSRARRFFGGPRRLFHRRSSSFPSRGRTRARTRRRDGSFDEKSILSSKVKKHHT